MSWRLGGPEDKFGRATKEFWTKVSESVDTAARFNGGEIEMRDEWLPDTNHPLDSPVRDRFQLYQELQGDTATVVDRVYELVAEENQFQCPGRRAGCLAEQRTPVARDFDAYLMIGQLLRRRRATSRPGRTL